MKKTRVSFCGGKFTGLYKEVKKPTRLKKKKPINLDIKKEIMTNDIDLEELFDKLEDVNIFTDEEQNKN